VDYKDWIANRADELALEKYGKDFYDLSGELQVEVYNQAMEEYKDHYADMIDAAYDRAVEARLFHKG